MAPSTFPTELQRELDQSIQRLEASLAGAAQAAAELRRALPKIAALTDVIGDIEETITRIRPKLAQAEGLRRGEEEPSPWLRPLGKETFTTSAPAESGVGAQDWTAKVFAPAEEEQPSAETEPEATAEPSHCLRLEVTTKGASLDLKAVDGVVNETAEVVDVALLDYDGRHASLKVWLQETSDAQHVRDTLREGLRQRFGEGAEIEVNFEEKSAA